MKINEENINKITSAIKIKLRIFFQLFDVYFITHNNDK